MSTKIGQKCDFGAVFLGKGRFSLNLSLYERILSRWVPGGCEEIFSENAPEGKAGKGFWGLPPLPSLLFNSRFPLYINIIPFLFFLSLLSLYIKKISLIIYKKKKKNDLEMD
jgi:hypothetical protein